MKHKDNRLIFHLDVNSAYLSWTAAYRLQQGHTLDLREVPSVVGGDPNSRHGIVLAKSIPAKKYGIETGEPLFSARLKCKELMIVPPNYSIYMDCSNAMMEILQEYTPIIQRFSIDECFLDMSHYLRSHRDILDIAEEIKNRIKKELGFTVNIGISNNKLLAKVASDLSKPDKIHTLFPEEIKNKMWPLPVGDLFMVGKATLAKLNKINIFTIGDLATYDINILGEKLKSQGILVWNYANGIEDSEVRKSNYINFKGMGNSTTLPFDVEDRETAHRVILSLCETTAMRLRDSHNCCGNVSVSFKSKDFERYLIQRKLDYGTNCTKILYEIACKLFDELWKGEAIRHMGIAFRELSSDEFHQRSIFEEKEIEKYHSIDEAVDSIRKKYGNKAIIKASFLHSGLKPLNGGIGEEDYPLMTSIL